MSKNASGIRNSGKSCEKSYDRSIGTPLCDTIIVTPGATLNVTREMILGIKKRVKKFLSGGHGAPFEEWWMSQTIDHRQLLIKATETRIKELTDSASTQSLHQRRHEKFLMLVPQFSSANLSESNVLVELLKSLVEPDQLLLKCGEYALRVRSNYRAKKWPLLSTDEAIRAGRETDLQRGDRMVNLLATGSTSDNDEALFLTQFHTVDDPAAIKNGTCTNIARLPAGDIHAYESGVLFHQFEVNAAKDALYLLLHGLAFLVDNYQRTVLGLRLSAEQKPVAACNSCKVAQTSSLVLSWCSQCNTVLYCGAKCQRDDWPTHKRLCRLHKANTVRAPPVEPSAVLG